MRAILALALALSACVGSNPRVTLPLDVGETHAVPEPRRPLRPISQPWRSESIDPEIFGILFAAHQRAIDTGKLAQENAADDRLQKLADAQVSRHADALDREVRLAQSLDMTTWDTGISRRLRRDGARSVEKLQKLHGTSFDRQYLSETIKQQTDMLRVIDVKLLPNVGSRELERSLQTDREDCVADLAEARAIQHRLD